MKKKEGFFERKIRRLDVLDISLTKMSVAAFVLFVLTFWPSVMKLANSINPIYFLIAFLVFASRPMYRLFR